MPESKSARERKLEARRRSSGPVSRRTSNVVSYSMERSTAPSKPKPPRSKAFNPMMGKPKGLSPEAEWDTLRPKNIHPLDWVRNYPGDDKDLWEDTISEIKAALKAGELVAYEGPVKK